MTYNHPVLSDEDKTWIRDLLQQQLQQHLQQHREEERRWVGEQLEKVETTLLTEFHKWASPQEMRQRTHAAAIRALDAEVESISTG